MTLSGCEPNAQTEYLSDEHVERPYRRVECGLNYEVGVVSSEELGEVVSAVDAAIARSWPPPMGILDGLGLEPVPAKSSHLVCRVVIDGERCCLKVFHSWARDEPEREWLLLNALSGSGVSPEPVWRAPAGVRPAVATTWLDGSGLGGRATLNEVELDHIAAAHAALHSVAPPATNYVAINAGRTVIERITQWWPQLGTMATELDLPDDVQRYLSGAPLAAETAATSVVGSQRQCMMRGDTNLANYLSDGTEIRMIDFEDGGIGDPCFEMADMIEHYANRSVAGHVWDELVTRAGVNGDDLRVARAVVAEFWLALTIRRSHGGLTMRPPLTPSEQMQHLAALRA